jgi:hypothetical protein
MAAAWVARRWVQTCLIGPAGVDGLLHGLVDFDDNALGAVIALVPLLVLAADDGEGVHDVGHGVVRGREAGFDPRQILRCFARRRTPVAVLIRRQIEVEEGSVQLAAEQEATLLVPSEW